MSASQIVVDKVREEPKIAVVYRTEVQGFHGDGKLSAVTIRNRQTPQILTLEPAGVFVFIGLSPNTGWLPPKIERDAHGFIVTRPTLETSVPGVFAAGDARQGSTSRRRARPAKGRLRR